MKAISRQIDLFSNISLDDINLARFLDNIEVGIIIINENNEIVHTNKRVEDLFGYEKAELAGQLLNILIQDNIVHTHQSHIDRFFKNPENRPMGIGLDLFAKKKDQEVIPVEVSISYLKTKEGKLGISFINDLRFRKKLENELRDANNELQAFAKTVAHDINNTLVGVVSLSELLAEQYDHIPQEKQKDLLLEVAQSGRKLSNIINELLLFASIDKIEVNLLPIEMKSVIDEALKRLHYLTSDVDISIKMADNFPLSLGHAAWIEEVWFNLISNAIKYGGNTPEIEFGFNKEDKWINYWIKDNGDGLTSEQVAVIFNATELAEKNIIKGHGLGLSIVKRIIEKQGGKVSVQSEEGRGSSFGFYLEQA